MVTCDSYDINKEKKVLVVYKSLDKKRTIVCYDDQNGVTKETEGFLWVRTKHILTGTPGVWSKAKWEKIAPLSKIEYSIVDEEKE
ncbi:MAG: hypothetical protein KAS73_09445 [Candidatus Sabulitectum sp.]|nr:hypothetical protein [Candidatus Sabulitectum sp.]